MTRRGILLVVWIMALGLYGWFPVWTAWQGMNNNDFKHLYLGMKALMDGISPYSFQALHHQAALQGHRQIALNPYVYLPFTGQALAFLAPLRLEHAAAAWFACNHVFAVGTIWLLSAMWPRQRWLAAGLLTLGLAVSFPFVRTLTAGQLNMALLFMICLGRHLLITQRARIAGGVLAFAALFKLMPGIFGLFFLLQRRWWAALSMTVAGIVLLVISTAWAGVGTTLEFVPILQQMGYGKSTWPEVFSFWDDPPNQSLNSFFTHILAQNDHTTPWIDLGQIFANGATYVAVLVLMLVYVVKVWRGRAEQGARGYSEADDHAFSATLLLGLLIPSLMWDHYLTMTLLPVAVLLRDSVASKRMGLGVAVVACYGVICIPWPFTYPRFETGAGIVLMSLKLWPTIILFGLNLCLVESQSWRRKGTDNLPVT